MTKNITIVGVGALGSHLVQLLRSEDVNIKVIDFDRVEQRNVMSQFHNKASVGQLKAKALKQAMNFLFKKKITDVSNKLTKDNVEALLTGDLLIDCLDNGEARRLVQGFARDNDVPCLHGALAADGAFGRVIWDEQFVIDDETPGKATCEDGEFLPFIALTAAFLARATQMWLRNNEKVGFSISPTNVMAV